MSNTCANIESLQGSVSPITSIPTGSVSVLPGDVNNDDDSAWMDVHKEAPDSDDKGQDQDQDWDPDQDNSTLPDIEDKCHWDDIYSKLTEDDQNDMLHPNWTLQKLLFEHQSKSTWETTLMFSELDLTCATDRRENPRSQSQSVRMVDPLQSCYEANELDKFVDTLRSSFASFKDPLPRGDHNQVKYAVSSLDTWNNHPNPAQWQMENTDPSEWANEVQ
jgi:hypothetical protein